MTTFCVYISVFNKNNFYFMLFFFFIFVSYPYIIFLLKIVLQIFTFYSNFYDQCFNFFLFYEYVVESFKRISERVVILQKKWWKMNQ